MSSEIHETARMDSEGDTEGRVKTFLEDRRESFSLGYNSKTSAHGVPFVAVSVHKIK